MLVSINTPWVFQCTLLLYSTSDLSPPPSSPKQWHALQTMQHFIPPWWNVVTLWLTSFHVGNMHSSDQDGTENWFDLLASNVKIILIVRFKNSPYHILQELSDDSTLTHHLFLFAITIILSSWAYLFALKLWKSQRIHDKTDGMSVERWESFWCNEQICNFIMLRCTKCFFRESNG